MPDPNNTKKIPDNENYIGIGNTYLNKLTSDYTQGKQIAQMPRQMYDAGESKYDEGFIIPETMPGVDPRTQLADWRGAQQSGWEQAGLFIPRALTKAASEVIKTPGYIVSGIEGIITGDFNKAMDNAYLNAIDNVEEDLKNEMAVYTPKEVREGGLGAALSSTSFWSTEGADALGYLLGMAVGSYGVKGLNIPGQLLKANKFVNLASKLPKLGGAAKIAGNIELGTMTILNSMSESVAESRGVVKDLQNTLTQIDPNTGQRAVNPKTGMPWTDEEINEAAGEAGRNSFYMNMGVLMVPNMIMNKNLFGRFSPSKRVIDELTDEAGNLIAHNPLTRKQIVSQYLSSMGKSMASEGLFEEGSQTAIENYVKKQATHEIDENWLTGVVEEYANMLGTTEGQKAILLGSVLGGLGGARGNYRNIKAEDEYKGKVSQILQKNFQGFTQLADVFEKDENGKLIMEPNQAGELQPKINMEKAGEFITTAIKEQNAGTMQDVLGMIGDKEGYERSFNQAFMRFALPYLNLEGGEEVLMKQIDGMTDKLNPINEAMGNNIDEMQFTNNLKQRVKELSKQTKFVKDQVARASAVLATADPAQVTKFTDRLVNAAIGEVGDQMLLREQLRSLDQEMSKMKSHPDAGAAYMEAAIAQQQEKIDSVLNELKESDDLYRGLFDPNEVVRGFEEYTNAQAKAKDRIDTYSLAVQEGRAEQLLAEESKSTEEKYLDALDRFYKAESVEELRAAVEEIQKSPLLTDEVRQQLNEDYTKAIEKLARRAQIDDIIGRKEELYNSLTDQIKQAKESIEEKEVEAEILQEDFASGKTKLSERGLARKINELNDAIKQLEDFIANAEAQRDQILAEVDYYGTEAAMDMDVLEANRDAKRRTIEDINKRIDDSKSLLDRLKDLLKNMTAVWNKLFPNKRGNLEKGRWEYIDAKSQINLKKSEIAEVNNLLAELEDIKDELIKQEEALTNELEEFKQVFVRFYEAAKTTEEEEEINTDPDNIEFEPTEKTYDPIDVKPLGVAFSSTAGNNMTGRTDKLTTDPDQLRWFTYTSRLKFNKDLKAYKLVAVTSKTNPFGDKLKFKDTERGEDIVFILYKDNQPVTVEGNLVFTSMWGNWTLAQAKERFSNPTKMTDEQIQQMLNNHNKLRETILASKEPFVLSAMGLTPGIRVLDETKDPEGNYIYKFPVVGRIVKTVDDIDDIEIGVATTNTITVGNYQIDATPGMVYIKTNGQVVPMRVSKLSEIDGAVDKVISLIKQLQKVASPAYKGDKTADFKKIYDQINLITLFANTKADSDFKIFMSKNGRLYYNGTYHDVINEDELRDFLNNKYFRVSNKALKLNEKSFKDPITGKTWPSYKHYLLSNKGRADNQVPVGTDLVGDNTQQFLNVGISYLANSQAGNNSNTSPRSQAELKTGTSPRAQGTERRGVPIQPGESIFGPIPPEGMTREVGTTGTTKTTTPTSIPGINVGDVLMKGDSKITIKSVDKYKVTYTTETGATQSMRIADFTNAIEKGSIKPTKTTTLKAGVSPRAMAGAKPTVDQAKLKELKTLVESTSDVTPILSDVFKVLNEKEYEQWQESLDPAQLQKELESKVKDVKTEAELYNVVTKYLLPKFIDSKLTTTPTTDATTDLKAKKADIQRRKNFSISDIREDKLNKNWYSVILNAKGEVLTVIQSSINKEQLIEDINYTYNAELAALEGAKPSEETTISAPIVEDTRVLFSEQGIGITLTAEDSKELESNPETNPTNLQSDVNSSETQSIVDQLNRLPSTETKGDDFGIPGLDRTFIGEEAATQAELDAEEEWFRLNFPNIEYTRLKNLIDGKAIGRFLKSGRVLISDLAAKGTTYHEAFHVVTQLYLTDKEIKALYKEYRDRTGKDLSDDATEEALAEDFRAYMLGEKLSFSPKQKNIFRRLLDAIKTLLGIGNPSIEELFNNIKSGAYKSSKPLVDKSNVKDYYAEIPGKDTAWTRDFMESTTVFFFKHLMKGNEDWSIENLFDTKNKAFIGTIYQRVKEDFINTYKALPEQYQKLLAQDYNFILAPTLSESEQNKRWNSLVSAHSRYLTKFGIEIKFKDNIDEIDPDSNVKGERNDYEDRVGEDQRVTRDNTYVDAINFSTKDRMPKSVKLLIASLPKVEMRDGKPKVIVNRFGAPSGIDYNRTMDWLHNKLANISDLGDMISTLNALSNDRPELKVLLSYLRVDPTNNLPVALNFEQARLVVQFWQQFAKTKNTYYTALIDDTGNFIFADSNSQRFRTKIQDRWSNAVKDSANSADGVFKLNPDGKIVLNNAKIQKLSMFTNPNDINSVISFFNTLGITFSTNKWNTITDYRAWETKNKDKSGKLLPEAKVIADEVSVLLNAYGAIKDFILNNEGVESLFQKDLIKGPMNSLAELEGKYNPNITESQHLSPDGKTVYDITLNTFLSNITNRINRNGIESIKHLNRKNNMYTRGSFFYDLLLAGKKLDLVVLSGMRINEPGQEGELTSDLKLGDFYVQSLNAVLANNIQFLRAADKKLEYAFHIDFDITTEQYEEQMIRYFYDDIARSIALVKDGVGSDIQYYKDNAKRSLLFEGIFKDNPKLIYDAKKVTSPDNFIKKNREAILSAIRNWSNEQIANKKVEFEQRGIIVKLNDKYILKGLDNNLIGSLFNEQIDLTTERFTSEEVDSILRIIHNKFTIGAIEQIKLFTGDLAFFKAKDFSKRTGGLTGPKKLSLVGNAINAYLNANMKRKDGKIADDNINVLVYNDVKAVSDNLAEYKEAIGYKADKYASYDEADAQGLVTLDEYREMMFRAGDWTPQQDAVYEKAISGEVLNPEELALIPPLKPQHYGPRTDVNNKLYIPTYYKLSLMPLIPSAIKGTSLEKLNKHMMDNKIGLTMFASANKVGNNINPDFYNEKGEINLPSSKELGNLLQEVDYAYMGIQVDNAPIEKTKVTFGTQYRGLILQNLFSFGKGKDIKILDARTNKETTKNTKDIADEYTGIVNELTSYEWDNLLTRLTLTKDNAGNYKIGDIKVFKDILISEAEDRAVAYNLVDYIERALGDDIKAVDFTLSKSKIENLLYSMVNNNVIRQKTNGDMKILASGTGFEMKARKFKDLPDGTKKLLGNDRLKFYTKTGPGGTVNKMQVLLPYYFKEKFAGQDLSNIDKELFNLTGFRIPTEGFKNIEAIEVVGFLPKEVGNMVVVPSEIVVKSGSDYDVDKLTLFIPNHIKVGNKYKYIPTSDKGLKKLYDEWVNYYNEILTNTQREIEEIGERYSVENDPELTLAMAVFGDDKARAQEIISGLINKEAGIKKKAEITFDEFKKNVRKKQLQNRIIEISNEILSSPELFAQLITPTSTDTLKALSEKVAKAVGISESKYGTSVIQLLNNAKTALNFWTGKGGVGIMALHNKSHALAQQANLSMKEVALYFGENNKPLYNTVDGTPTGDVSLAGEFDVKNGNRISDMLAEFLNSYLDVAKDPFILNMNGGTNTSNVWALLIRAGVPIETATYFMNQPIVRNYLTLQSRNETMFREATQDNFSKVLSKDQVIDTIKNIYKVKSVKVREASEYVLMSNDRLEKMMDVKVTKDDAFYIDQLQILDNFIQYQENAKDLSELQKALSSDTKGSGKNRNEARSTMKALAKLREKDVFDGIDRYINDTILKEFFNAVNESQNMYNELFVTDMPKSRESLNEIEEFIDNLGFTSDTAAELTNLAENEFVSFLLQTIKTDNKYLSQRISDLFTGAKSLPNRLLAIKRDKNNSLSKNPLIEELFPIIRGNTTDVIKRFNRQMNPYEQNVLVDAFNEVYEKNRELAEDIVKFGIIQSGLNNSPITFNTLIPADLFFAIANPILKQYIASEEINTSTFFTQFLLNNYSGKASKLVRKVKATGSDTVTVPLKRKDGSDNPTAKYPVVKTITNTARKNETPVWETALYLKIGGDESRAIYRRVPLLGDGYNIHRYYPDDIFTQMMAGGAAKQSIVTKPSVEISEDDVEYNSEVNEEIPPVLSLGNPTSSVSPRAQAMASKGPSVSPRAKQGIKQQAPATPGKLREGVSPRATSMRNKQDYNLLPDKIKANLAKVGIDEKVFNNFTNEEQQQALKCHG